MLSHLALVLAASSSDQGFSMPILVGAAALAVAWLALSAVVVVARRPPEIHVEGTTQDLPPEPPAIAGLLCDDFELQSELAPATLLDLAARQVVRLEEVQPGKTVCRLREQPAGTAALAPYEQQVLEAVSAKAIDGVVPADALSTGTEDQARSWHRAYGKAVVADAQGRGLTRDRWPKRVVALISSGVLPIGAVLYVAGAVGGDTSGRRGPPAVIAAAVAVGGIALLVALSGRLGRSRAQLPTDAGRAAAARCLALRAHLREDEQLDELSPAAVQLWGRHLAYAAAMGVARTSVEQLPMGAEDDHRAWSRYGGRWRRVRVRYPRARPPAWGKHPAFATLLGVLWGGIAVLAIYSLVRVARAAAGGDSGLGTGVTRQQLDWIGRSALIAIIPFAVVLAWSLWVLVRAVPDLWLRRQLGGDIVRARRRAQLFKSGSEPKYWYYLAVDDGHGDRIRSLRLRGEIYGAHPQGETVTAVVTPNLGYVREMRSTHP